MIDANLFSSVILSGLFTTLFISFVSLLFGIIPGVVLFLGKICRIKVIDMLCSAYIQVFEGIPLLLQILFLYYALPLVFSPLLNFPRIFTAIIILSLNASARIPGIAKHYIKDNAKIYDVVFILKVLTLSIIKVFGDLIKYSTLLSIIAISELARVARMVGDSTGNINVYFIVILIFLAISIVIKLSVKLLEKVFFKERKAELIYTGAK